MNAMIVSSGKKLYRLGSFNRFRFHIGSCALYQMLWLKG